MLFIAADHAGYPLKEELKPYLQELGFEVVDLGNEQLDPSDDYPDFAYRLTQNVLENADSKGILICGTGQGVCIAANKVDGIRAALVHDEFTARTAAEHINANVICLGGRVTDDELAKKIVKMWLETEFLAEERHERRLEKIENIERS
ncbi:MAG: ribose 5-phosphate isomerase B [Candidatus Portnoybacteria bacterium RBG_13_41_18]|uniref:Ribose 5-phosphate isomerase B n=1 Tax=Candidatus Portnoybacteria bacterium RBG_13_41_18 TaxID=1801991 RepID=A0A1G2FAX3_9BACT|nr:MAG: ribose 5-phosphate isomerase B [Candidatus Portnoybacteria bacterium RBG_13_41_18]